MAIRRLTLKEIRRSIPGYSAVRNARVKWKEWRTLRFDYQLTVSVITEERDAAVQELEYLRERFVDLERKAVSSHILKANEVRFCFPEHVDFETCEIPQDQAVITKSSRGRIVWNGLSDN